MLSSFWFILMLFLIHPHFDSGCFSKKRCKASYDKNDNVTATRTTTISCVEVGCKNNGEFKISSCKCECILSIIEYFYTLL